MSDSPIQSPLVPEESGNLLGLTDVISLLVGIVIGVSIFKVSPQVFSAAGSPTWGLLVWIIGAAMAFCGALCYAELSASLPHLGGDYLYLCRAYGRRVGLLFAWMQMGVVLTGNIGAMAFVFADYAAEILPALKNRSALVASVVILMLAGIHWIGVNTGKWVQNLLTGAKILTLSGLVICGLLLPVNRPEVVFPPDVIIEKLPAEPSGWGGVALSLVFVLYAYGGWTDAAMVAGEMKDARRKMPLALLGGLAIVATLYVTLNLAYLRQLGFAGLTASSAPVADVVGRTLGKSAAIVISVLIMMASLGAIHGMLYVWSRLLPAVGAVEPILKPLTHRNRRNVPARSLGVLIGISVALVLILGSDSGREGLDVIARGLGVPETQLGGDRSAFDMLVASIAPVFWMFAILTSLSVIVLRIKEPDLPRPFRVPGYPITPLLSAGIAVFMLVSSLLYARELVLLAVPILGVGLLLVLCSTFPRWNR